MAPSGSSKDRRELAVRGLLLLEHAVFFVVACRTLKIWKSEGIRGIYSSTFKALRNLPGVEPMIQALLRREVEGAVRKLAKSESQIARDATRPMLRLPLEGIAGEELLEQLEALRSADMKGVEQGLKSMGYVYTTEREGAHCKQILEAFRVFCEKTGHPSPAEHDKFVQMAFTAFVCENGSNPTNPTLIPAIRKCENEVIAMTAAMLHGDEEVVGTLTSGTAESILLAVKTYRDLARTEKPLITDPEMILPITAHPAFIKAGALFNIKCVCVPVGPDSRVSLEAVQAAITQNTILLVASAPQYPHGVVDPIPHLGEMALEHAIPLHVDACFGAFMLPFLEKLGHEVTRWDFRVRGVSSISADLHKYGYCFKGCGVILYRDEAVREYQFFSYLDWPGGVFGSPLLVGSRPGGSVAAAWMAMMVLGENGYLRLAKTTAEVTTRLKEGIRNIRGLGLVAEPEMTCLAILSRDAKVDILLIGDAMEERGWYMERQQNPLSLHLSVMPHHKEVCDKFLLDLRASVENVRRRGAGAIKTKGKAAVFDFITSMPDRALLSTFITKLYSETYRLRHDQHVILSPSPTNSETILEGVEEDEEEEEDD